MCPRLRSLCKGKPQGSCVCSHHCHQLLLPSENNTRRICLPSCAACQALHWYFLLKTEDTLRVWDVEGSFLFVRIFFFNYLEKTSSCGNCKFLNLFDSYMKLTVWNLNFCAPQFYPRSLVRLGFGQECFHIGPEWVAQCWSQLSHTTVLLVSVEAPVPVL